jgi:hypothetical protein
MAVLAMYILSPFGIRDRNAAGERMLEEIRMESQAFCERFGMPAGTKEHQQCLFGLELIRANEDRRSGLAYF